MKDAALTIFLISDAKSVGKGDKPKSELSYSKENHFSNPDEFWPISSTLHGDGAPASSITAVLHDAILTAGESDLDAVELDGTSGSFLRITNTGDLDGDDAFSWYFNIYPYASQKATILEYAGVGGSGNGVKLSQDGTKIVFELYDKNGKLLSEYSRNCLEVNKWKFVGFAYNKIWGHMDLIDSDIQYKDIEKTDVLVNAVGDVTIGNSVDGTSPFQGKISCIQFYTKAIFGKALKNPPSYCSLAQWSSSVLDWTITAPPTTTTPTTSSMTTLSTPPTISTVTSTIPTTITPPTTVTSATTATTVTASPTTAIFTITQVTGATSSLTSTSTSLSSSSTTTIPATLTSAAKSSSIGTTTTTQPTNPSTPTADTETLEYTSTTTTTVKPTKSLSVTSLVPDSKSTSKLRGFGRESLTDACFYFNLVATGHGLDPGDIILDKKVNSFAECAQLCTSHSQCIVFVTNNMGDCQLSSSMPLATTAETSSRMYSLEKVDKDIHDHENTKSNKNVHPDLYIFKWEPFQNSH